MGNASRFGRQTRNLSSTAQNIKISKEHTLQKRKYIYYKEEIMSEHTTDSNLNNLHTHDGVHYHAHGDHHSHEHGHVHSHEHTKAVLNRMSRAIGHMEAVKKMVEDGRDCSEVLVQIAAVRSAINNIGKIILEDHINHCVLDALETGDDQVIKDLNEAIKKFVK